MTNFTTHLESFTMRLPIGRVLGLLLLTTGSQAIQANDSTVLARDYPELQQLLLAHDVVQARAYEEITITNSSPTATIGQRVLMDTLLELEETKGSHYHTAGDHSSMLGPHRVFESRATPGLLGVIREDHNAEEVRTALADIGNLPPVAVDTLQRGRQFIEQLIEIYLNPVFEDKKAAVSEAVQAYLADEQHSVADRPKSDELLSDHPYAYAYKAGFPQLSGLTWASQWLKVALLEILVFAPDKETRDADIQTMLSLYGDKITRLHGSFVSLPSDIPTNPVIAPNFYSLHPDAAYIIDNLELLKVVIGDILAHPEVEDRWLEIERAVANYTEKTSNLSDETDYLLYVLRGGIYNAGGPARGGLTVPDRNWTREQVENPHISTSPMAQ
ncbi:MAG: hypothetical protein MI746_12380 [Pseudomonadales bacterium]|nr:hypothetical protein [Pseudomonadales bacterium]